MLSQHADNTVECLEFLASAPILISSNLQEDAEVVSLKRKVSG